MSFEATVKFEPKNTPPWFSNPGVRQAYADEIARVSRHQEVTVELVRTSTGWRPKSQGVRPDLAQSVPAPIAVIPPSMEARALQELTKSTMPLANNTRGFPIPFALADVLAGADSQAPGTVFLSAVPNPAGAWRQPVEESRASITRLQTQIATARTRGFTAVADAFERELAGKTKALESFNAKEYGQTQPELVDAYLNGRQELQELLEALAAAGAFTRRPVTAGELPGITSAGVLYSPNPGLRIFLPRPDQRYPQSQLLAPPIEAVGPLEQWVISVTELGVRAHTRFADEPRWLTAVRAAKPAYRWFFSPSPIEVRATAGAPSDFPYRFNFQPNFVGY